MGVQQERRKKCYAPCQAERKEKPTPAKRPRALRKVSLTSKLPVVSEKSAFHMLSGCQRKILNKKLDSKERKKDIRLPFGRVNQGKSLPSTPTEGVHSEKE
eukprot:1141572-Pelagomonas_calceolata.AAC.3